MKIFRLLTALLVITLTVTAGCGNRKTVADVTDGGKTITSESRLLTMTDAGGYIVAEVADPWNEGATLARYILVDRDSALPDPLPEGTLVRTPLRKSTVYSAVHARTIEELGAIDGVTGIADGSFYKMPSIIGRLADGTVTDIGSSMSPTLEKLVMLSPDAILLSPFQNAGHGVVEKIGAPIIECADYMESTPLARAEWIKLLGALYGRLPRAVEIYDSVAASYRSLASTVDSVTTRPAVISEMMTDGVWYVPGGNSYMAAMFADAGARYPWSDDLSSGSIQLDFPAVYAKAGDADYWLLRTTGSDMTLDTLADAYPLNSRMKAFGSGGVYSVNTAETTFYEDFPFHPDRLLHDFINIFHPGTLPDSGLHYYKNVR